MAPGPSRPGVYGGQDPSFVSLHLSRPSHHHPTAPHLLPNVTPRLLLSPSSPSFLLGLSFTPFAFIHWTRCLCSNWIQHFSLIEFFILNTGKRMCESVSARTESELLSFPSYSSSPNGAMSRDFLVLLLHTQLILTVCMTLGRKYCYSQKETYVPLVRAAEDSATFYTCPLCIEGGLQIP